MVELLIKDNHLPGGQELKNQQLTLKTTSDIMDLLLLVVNNFSFFLIPVVQTCGYLLKDTIMENLIHTTYLIRKSHPLFEPTMYHLKSGMVKDLPQALLQPTRLKSLDLHSPTPFTNLVNEKAVSSPVFSFLLGRAEDNSSSEFLIGEVDPKFAKNIKYHKVVDNPGFWQIALDGAQVNGDSVDVIGRQAIIDTGTTLIIIPSDDADAIHSAIPGSIKEGK